MGLVSGFHTMTMRPFHPLQGKILIEQVAECLTIVCQCLIAIIFLTKQFRQVIFQSVTAPSGKLLKQCGRPVGTIHLITVVEHRGGEWCATLFEGTVKLVKITPHRLSVEMVYHESLATGCSTFHRLIGTSYHDTAVCKHRLTRSLIRRHLRPAERPSRAAVHIHLYVILCGYSLYSPKHLHPLWRKKWYFTSLIIHHPIQRCYLHGADTRPGIFLKGTPQVTLIQGGAEPPPACAGACLTGCRSVCLLRINSCADGDERKKDYMPD